MPERAAQALLAARQKAGDFDPALALLDSTVVRAHQHAAGARKKKAASGKRPWAARAGGLSTKIHLGAVATRYDKLDGMFAGLVVLCSAGIALR